MSFIINCVKALLQFLADQYIYRHVPRNFIRLAAHGASFCEGNFAEYFKLLLTRAKHVTNGYHNLTHTTHVTWNAVLAAAYYVPKGMMTKREARDLIIAAMFHDWNHSGTKLTDSDQLARAYAALDEHLLPADRARIDRIKAIIAASEYPYKELGELSLSQQLMREIDGSQALPQTWLQEVLFGLAQEWQMGPLQVLAMQQKFLSGITLVTDWGKRTFEAAIAEKLKDVQLLEREILKF